MKIAIETIAGGFEVLADDGQGYTWTPDPERALDDVRLRLAAWVAADLALRREGAPRHIRVLAGICPTCALPVSDCVGVNL